MVNNQEFGKRLQEVMDYHHLTATVFADKISVQRSSISHILSGRNKPSLDFVLKVTAAFNDVDLYWLLNGKGSFPKQVSPATTPTSIQSNETVVEKTSKSVNASKEIQRIVVFYADGTFEEYMK